MLLTIEKLVYGGDGLARLPATGDGAGDRRKAVFVPFVLESEQVQAEIVDDRGGFARAQPEQIVHAASERITARCPYFALCGGCHYQHTTYEHQLQIKTAILRENLRRQGGIDWTADIPTHSAEAWNYRNRTRMQLRTAPEFTLAYYRFGSHDLLPIEQCPISSPLINRAIATLWELGRAGAIPTNSHEIEFFADAGDEHLLLELYVDGSSARDAERLFLALRKDLPAVESLAVFARPDRRDAFPRLLRTFGASDLVYRTASAQYRVGPGSFFQTNRHLTDTLVELATSGRSGRLALDLYSGVGLFSLVLARSFEQVIAVEAAPTAVRDLQTQAPPNLRVIRSTTQQYLAAHGKQPRPDYVVVDPPRAGLGDKIARDLLRLNSPRLTYVSCDPATLSRDLRVLTGGGYRIDEVHLVDLFPQTFHIETVVKVSR